jgi:2-amino-4-hydroxy-6-hydroxymethyldihydropteridine diphosphokinase
MNTVFIGIGSNIGDKYKHVSEALDLLKVNCDIMDISSCYLTTPIGYKEQSNFINLVIKVETDLDPDNLMDFLLEVESSLGRTRSILNGPRKIDLDILFYNQEIINNDKLCIPHPRLQQRLFVLIPMSEIDPDFSHPVINKTIGELANSFELVDQLNGISMIDATVTF